MTNQDSRPLVVLPVVAALIAAATLLPLLDRRRSPSPEAVRSSAAGSERRPIPPDEFRGELVSHALAPELTEFLVVDTGSGNPVRGASVVVYDQPEGLADVQSVTITAEGKAGDRGIVLLRVSPLRVQCVRASAPGYASSVLSGVTPGGSWRVELSRPAKVRGVILGEGISIGTAVVTITREGRAVRLARTESNSEGKYEIAGLPSGRAIMQVRASRFVRRTILLDISEGADIDLDVKLEPSQPLIGRVIDDRTGAGIEGVELSDSWTFRVTARSDRAGRFELLGESRGRREIHVRKRGYAAVVVDSEHAKETDIRLVQGASIVGRVLGGEATFIDVVAVAGYKSPGGDTSRHSRAVKTDINGNFLVSDLAFDRFYTLHISATATTCGRVTIAVPRSLASGATLDLGTIYLGPGISIRGRVIDEHGDAVGGVRVRLRGMSKDVLRLSGPVDLYHQPEEMERQVSCDSIGRFRFVGVAAGTYRVSAHAADSIGPVQSVVTVGTRDKTDVVLRTSSGIAISGRVAAPNASATMSLADIVLMARAPSGSGRLARVGADGRFRIPRLSPGKYELCSVRGPQGWRVRSRAEVAAGATDVRLQLVPAARITGFVRDLGGQPSASRLWLRTDEQGAAGILVGETTSDGAFVVEVEPGFTGTIVARPTGGRNTRGQLRVAAGDRDVELWLR